SLDLLRNSSVNVTLTNSMGQVVNTYIYENVNAGNNSLNLNLSDYAEGVYFFNIITNEGSTTKKVILSK
ncbi:T9SS type A sorting domain-containing protein, partial [Bacteroidia bacterium]|nr:T9SS type A sorting domain-containing protein [Bacteroidia bacterium]